MLYRWACVAKVRLKSTKLLKHLDPYTGTPKRKYLDLEMMSSTFSTYSRSFLGAAGGFLAVWKQSSRARQRLKLGTFSGDKQLPPVLLSVRLGRRGEFKMLINL